ncbi:MAG: amidohydrolase family protein [Alphaproteobacteria bacterium]|nr:amidohydrolase family protein [Alphaproteobacteria bacterium]
MTTVLAARHAVLPTPDGGLEVVPAHVTVEHGWITAVERAPEGGPPPGADELGDHLLTPAFVAPHTHLALAALRGPRTGAASTGNVVEDWFFPVERALLPEDVRAFTAVGAREALLHGVACAWEHFYAPQAVLQGLQDAGLAGVVAPPLQDLSGPGVGHAEENLQRTAALAADDRLAAQGLGVALGPHATDTVSDALWRRVADVAAHLGLPVHTHVAQSPEELARSLARHGTTPLTRLARLGVLDAGSRWLLVHALFATDAELRALDPTRHCLVTCPRAMAQAGFPSPVAAWEEAGATWVVAPDAPAGNDGVDPQAELAALVQQRTADVATSPELAAFRAGGSAEPVWARRQEAWTRRASLGDPVALLHRVWTLPGALHPELPCGVLRAGTLAHLALWDLRHPTFWPAEDPLRALALGRTSGALAQLMVAGRWRTARGQHASLGHDDTWQALRAEASGRRAALLRRAGVA